MRRGRTPKKNQKSKNNWDKDHYTQQAKKDNYPARSVYKLKEIQQKFTLIKKGDKVLDLGCFPGSWLIYSAETTGPDGSVFGIDLNAVEAGLPPNATAFTGDILDLDEGIAAAVGKEFNVVLSDMAPATTGMKDVDAMRSFELCSMALSVAMERLVPGGAFVCKIFQGGAFNEFTGLVKSVFNKHKIFKPESCRKQSREIFIIGIGKK
jgi:23S rRNA (uridine2552-2'-O)-methyltransferase